VLLLYLALRVAFTPVPDAWNAAAPSPIPLFESPSAVVAGKLYTFGGFSEHRPAEKLLVATNQAHVYDPGTDRWTRLADMPTPVTHLNPAVDGSAIWFAGGFQGNHPGPAITDVWKYDTESDRWSPGPPLPEARGGGGLVRVGRTLHYFGGYYAALEEPSSSDHWALALDGGTAWEKRAPLPVSRGHFGTVAHDDQVYVIGGSLTHHPNTRDCDLVDAYDARNDTWRSLAKLPYPRSHFEPGTFLFDGWIVIVGGRDDQSKTLSQMELSDVTAYDIAADTWREVGTLPHPIRAPVAQVIGDRLIVSGGSVFWAQEPQTQTFTVSCTRDAGSYCAPGGWRAFRLELASELRSVSKAIARVTPWRLQLPLGLDRIADPPAS
jgi:Kelch motif/Galactose oxidase, central domain